MQCRFIILYEKLSVKIGRKFERRQPFFSFKSSNSPFFLDERAFLRRFWWLDDGDLRVVGVGLVESFVGFCGSIKDLR